MSRELSNDYDHTQRKVKWYDAIWAALEWLTREFQRNSSAISVSRIYNTDRAINSAFYCQWPNLNIISARLGPPQWWQVNARAFASRYLIPVLIVLRVTINRYITSIVTTLAFARKVRMRTSIWREKKVFYNDYHKKSQVISRKYKRLIYSLIFSNVMKNSYTIMTHKKNYHYEYIKHCEVRKVNLE